MLGAIFGDVVGSRFEWHNYRKKDFELLPDGKGCEPTDDSILSLAIARAILDCGENTDELGKAVVKRMREFGKLYPGAGYGGRFSGWLSSPDPRPYRSFGNGAAMRVSACGFAARSEEECRSLSQTVTEVTHNHPEGLKGAEATAVAIYHARKGMPMEDIRALILEKYYRIDFKLDEIRDTYPFDESCQGTVPQALEAFFESTDFEDAIRNAVSIGGDSDTVAAITGGIAEAYYGIPLDLRKRAISFLDDRLRKVLLDFEAVYPAKIT